MSWSVRATVSRRLRKDYEAGAEIFVWDAPIASWRFMGGGEGGSPRSTGEIASGSASPATRPRQ